MEQIYLQNRFHNRQLKNRLKSHISLNQRGNRIRKGERRNVRFMKIIKGAARFGSLAKDKRKNSYRSILLLLGMRGAHRKTNYTTIYIHSTHNNTLYTFVNARGRTEYCVSTGMCGFKNARKSTSYASQAAAEKLAALAKNYHIAQVVVKMSGLGAGKLSGVRALNRVGFRVKSICECTTLPHNGCRPPQRRRI